MQWQSDKWCEREATRKRAAERKAKHDGPRAARVLNDTAQNEPRKARKLVYGGSWS
jgi:hypothetical protein